MKDTIITFVCFLLFSTCANAQISKIIHQTFEVDEANKISLNLTGEYEIEKWSGNTIMTETNIELYEASSNILKHYVEAGRYEIELQGEGEQIQLVSKDLERRALRTRNGECPEIVKLKLYVPEDFTVIDQNTLDRSDAPNEVTVKKNK